MALPHDSAARPVEVRSVYDDNLEHEFALIRQVAASCPYITLDTEFPGVVYQARDHPWRFSPDQRYSLVKQNVDDLKLIQLGLTLATSDKDDGHILTWEFNFRGFNPVNDAHAPDSVRLLESQGIDIYRNYNQGIDPHRFAYLFWSLGLLCNFCKTWITFHGVYDLAFLLKILSGSRLPSSMHSFQYLITCYFGYSVLDAKHLTKSCNGVYGGLENVGRILKVERVTGSAHQAGSDSLFIWHVYKKMRHVFFKNGIEPRHAGILCGIQDL